MRDSTRGRAHCPHFFAIIDCSAEVSRRFEHHYFSTHIGRVSLDFALSKQGESAGAPRCEGANRAHLFHLIPVGAEGGTITLLVALDHRPPLLVGGISVELLEHLVDGDVSSRVGILARCLALGGLLFSGRLDESVPVGALLRGGRVRVIRLLLRDGTCERRGGDSRVSGEAKLSGSAFAAPSKQRFRLTHARERSTLLVALNLAPLDPLHLLDQLELNLGRQETVRALRDVNRVRQRVEIEHNVRPGGELDRQRDLHAFRVSLSHP